MNHDRPNTLPDVGAADLRRMVRTLGLIWARWPPTGQLGRDLLGIESLVQKRNLSRPSSRQDSLTLPGSDFPEGVSIASVHRNGRVKPAGSLL